VAEKMVNSEGYFHDEIPLDEEPVDGDVANEIAEYFGASSDNLASSGGEWTK
jgi:hypothetical protein